MIRIDTDGMTILTLVRDRAGAAVRDGGTHRDAGAALAGVSLRTERRAAGADRGRTDVRRRRHDEDDDGGAASSRGSLRCSRMSWALVVIVVTWALR